MMQYLKEPDVLPANARRHDRKSSKKYNAYNQTKPYQPTKKCLLMACEILKTVGKHEIIYAQIFTENQKNGSNQRIKNKNLKASNFCGFQTNLQKW